MGSTGSGSFSDYNGFKGTAGSNQGGSSGEDKCGKGFSAPLEEVRTCDYYTTTGNLPAVDSQVTVAFINPRLAIIDSKGICIGYLPTEFNYLRICMADGFIYAGIVSTSSLIPMPSVSVLISPTK